LEIRGEKRVQLSRSYAKPLNDLLPALKKVMAKDIKDFF
jgi:hypothetical protein